MRFARRCSRVWGLRRRVRCGRTRRPLRSRLTSVAPATSTTSTTSSVPPVTSVADTLPAPVSATVTSVEDHGGTDDSHDSGSGTSGRRGSASNTVVPEIDDSGSEQHATTTDAVSNTGPSVPESGSGGVPTTEGSGSGRGSSGSGSGSGADDRLQTTLGPVATIPMTTPTTTIPAIGSRSTRRSDSDGRSDSDD